MGSGRRSRGPASCRGRGSSPRGTLCSRRLMELGDSGIEFGNLRSFCLPSLGGPLPPHSTGDSVQCPRVLEHNSSSALSRPAQGYLEPKCRTWDEGEHPHPEAGPPGRDTTSSSVLSPSMGCLGTVWPQRNFSPKGQGVLGWKDSRFEAGTESVQATPSPAPLVSFCCPSAVLAPSMNPHRGGRVTSAALSGG